MHFHSLRQKQHDAELLWFIEGVGVDQWKWRTKAATLLRPLNFCICLALMPRILQQWLYRVLNQHADSRLG